MIRLYNDNLGRALHEPLYKRLYDFASKHNPELPCEIAVNNWLSRLYNSDPLFHLLVTLNDKYEITEHAVIEVTPVYNVAVIQCMQCQLDRPSISHAVQLMEYLDKLKAETNAACILFSIHDAKHAKTFEKRHGYKVSKTMLIKTDDEVQDE